MIIAVASFKGGVGKTTSAVHLAAFLQQQGSTLFVDCDPNRSASRWSSRGQGLPFTVIDHQPRPDQMACYDHVVIDTQARPSPQHLDDLVETCDLMILPATPDALALDGLMLTVDVLKSLHPKHFQVLLTVIPPWPSRDGAEARSFIQEAGLPIFQGWIRRMVAFQKAALAGVPVYRVSDPKARIAWNDYVAVGQEILP